MPVSARPRCGTWHSRYPVRSPLTTTRCYRAGIDHQSQVHLCAAEENSISSFDDAVAEWQGIIAQEYQVVAAFALGFCSCGQPGVTSSNLTWPVLYRPWSAVLVAFSRSLDRRRQKSRPAMPGYAVSSCRDARVRAPRLPRQHHTTS